MLHYRRNYMVCPNCSRELSDTATMCPNCGHPITPPGASPKKQMVTFLLCLFAGSVGAHRFYTGKIGTGILQALLLVTGMALLFVWAFSFDTYSGISSLNGEEYSPQKTSFTLPILSFAIIIGLSIWCIIDLIRIVCSKFTDSKGLRIDGW